MDTKKLLIITWIFLAFLIGAGVGYVVGLKGFGQRQTGPPAGQPEQFGSQQQGPGQMMQQQGPGQSQQQMPPPQQGGAGQPNQPAQQAPNQNQPLR